MCDAGTVSIVATIVGGAVSTIGQIQAGQAAAAAGKFQQQVARRNAILAERAADAASARGESQAARQGLKNRQLLGLLRTRSTGLGDVNFGSAVDLAAGTQAAGATNIELIRRNAELEALGFIQQAANFRQSGALARFEGDSARVESFTGAFGTILTTAGSVSDKFTPTKRPSIRRTRATTQTVFRPSSF